MADQSIKVIIGGRDYPLKAATPEMEQLMRIAAEQINAKLDTYNAKYPDMSMQDKLAFVALQESVSKLSFNRRLISVKEEAESLLMETTDYLEAIEKR